MDSDKRKADVSDSDDDFAPSADASPVAKAKPTKKKAKSAQNKVMKSKIKIFYLKRKIL